MLTVKVIEAVLHRRVKILPKSSRIRMSDEINLLRQLDFNRIEQNLSDLVKNWVA